MTSAARSALTLAGLALLVVVAAVWGWAAATEPLPAKVNTAICSDNDIAAGEKVFPQDVSVNVYNAGTREGLAGRVMKEFADAGFAEGYDGNAPPGSRVAVSQVWTPDPESPAVELVASHLGPDVEVVRRGGMGLGVTVVIGDDYTKLVAGRKSVVASEDTTICSPPLD